MISIFIVASLFLLTLSSHVSVHAESTQLTNVDDFPEFEMGDKVEFYFIEGVFPFTTPNSIKSKMGDMWNKYSLSHAGLGIWNKDTDVKYSLEIVCLNYTDALFPIVIDDTTMEWNNHATIVMTYPISESLWSESRLVAVSNGAAYECIRTYLLDNHKKKYKVYQPVSVNAFDLTHSDHVGEASIPFLDSYKFTFELLQELANYGVDLDAFLGVERTGWSYIAETDDSPHPRHTHPDNSMGGGVSISLYKSRDGEDLLPSITVLQWGEDDPVPTNVTEWYTELEACYEDNFDSGMGGSSILNSLRSCYESGYAFVYASPTSVYQVALAQDGMQNYFAPIMWRHDEDLPTESSDAFVGWDLADTIVSSITIIGIFCALTYFVCTRCYQTPRRRNASKHWEEEATRTVHEAIAGGDRDDGIDSNSIERDYFFRDTDDFSTQNPSRLPGDNYRSSDSVSLFCQFSTRSLYAALGMKDEDDNTYDNSRVK